MRVGIGYDVHKLVENRALILGGTEIPWEKGLQGMDRKEAMKKVAKDRGVGKRDVYRELVERNR